jgi:hypothetical protein
MYSTSRKSANEEVQICVNGAFDEMGVSFWGGATASGNTIATLGNPRPAQKYAER